MDDLSLWLRLLHTPGLGAARCNKLISTFGDIHSIFNANSTQLTQAGIPQSSISALLDEEENSAVTAAVAWQSEDNNHILTIDQATYPERLRQIARPPAVLFVKGNVDILNDPQLAMVGSRNPSQGGSDNAFQFAKHLSASGLLITSGLALGVDGDSHRGAIAATAPTIAVVATGLDRVYPARHKPLVQDILKNNGVIVSEFPLGTSPKAELFPARNRIIAGLSLGTLVVEAAVRSGSLITARLAQESGREVFAIPGSIHNPMSKGCHALIKQGAKLVESANDILEELAPQLKEALIAYPHSTPNIPEPLAPSPKSLSPESQNQEQQVLLDAMGYDPISIDQLADNTDFTTAELSSMLLILELEGHISSEAGGRYQRRK